MHKFKYIITIVAIIYFKFSLSKIKIQQYLQEVSFSVSGEHVNFDMKGDSIPSYDLINWQRLQNGDTDFVKVGIYDGAMDAGKELVIQDEKIKWPVNQSKARCSHKIQVQIKSVQQNSNINLIYFHHLTKTTKTSYLYNI